MDVRFINPFLEATINVLKTMAFVDHRPGKPHLKTDNIAIGDVSAIIGLTGSAKGSLALSFSEQSIKKIVNNMLGEKFTEINDDIRDAVGEITNMISGDARKRLEPNFPENYTYAMAGSWISKDLRISRCGLVTSVRI